MKLNLTAQEVLDKKFPISPRGYDALTVDEFLDKIIRDYETVENNVLIEKKYQDNKDKKIKELEKKIDDLKIEIQRYKSRLEGIENNSNATVENADLLKRISALEKYLYRIGINPATIK